MNFGSITWSNPGLAGVCRTSAVDQISDGAAGLDGLGDDVRQVGRVRDLNGVQSSGHGSRALREEAVICTSFSVVVAFFSQYVYMLFVSCWKIATEYESSAVHGINNVDCFGYMSEPVVT